MSFAKRFTPAPDILPFLNLGAGFDIPTGRYLIGKFGESILNGGLSYLTGFAGGGNKFKSTVMWYMLLTILDRYSRSEGVAYDTEKSLTIQRFLQLVRNPDNITREQLSSGDLLTVTSLVEYSGNKFYDLLKSIAEERKKDAKEHLRDTPFVDRFGNPMKCFSPIIAGIDSLSNFSVDTITAMQDANELGDSGRNTIPMRNSLIKTQMLMELPQVTASAGLYTMLSAHVGKQIQMDPMKPNAKKLQHLKQDYSFKDVPEKFSFLMNNCWFMENAETMMVQATKTPEYPRNSDDDLKGDTDLNRVYIKNLRAKSGPTGMPFEVIVSQSDGLLPGLTALNMMKQFKFGLGGHDRAYFNELLPDAVMQRTTARGKLDTNARLRRAMEITMEMCQIYAMWHDYDQKLICDAAELRAQLGEKGYKVDELLDTRGYWTFNDDPNPRKFLSTQDLLKMRVGDYHPHWMTDKLTTNVISLPEKAKAA